MGVVKGEAQVTLDGKQAENTLAILNKRAKELKAEYISLSKTNPNNPKLKEIDAELKSISKTTQSIKKQTFEYQKVLNNLSGASLQELNKAKRALTIQTAKLKRGTDEYKKSAGDLSKVNAEISKVRKEMKGAGVTTRNFGINLKNIGVQILSATGIIGGFQMLVSVFQKYNKSADEVFDIQKKLQSSLELTDQYARANAATIRALSNTFKEDYNKTTEAAIKVSKELDISVGEAIEHIEEGFLKGSNKGGEFLDILNEYPAQFRNMGVDANTFFAIVNKQATEGVFSDKGVDSIKEAAISIREMTPATNDALRNIGLSGEQIQKKLKDGSTTMFEVIQQISGKLSEFPPQSKEVGAAIADIFRGAGEDAGLRFLTSLKDIDGSLEDVNETIGENQRQTLEMEKSWNGFVASVSNGEGIFSRASAKIKEAFAGIFKSLQRYNEGLDIVDQTLMDNEKVQAAVNHSVKKQSELLKAATTDEERRTIAIQRTKVIQESLTKLQEIANKQEEEGVKSHSKSAVQLKVKMMELQALEKELSKYTSIQQKTNEEINEEAKGNEKASEEARKRADEIAKANARMRDMLRSMNIQLIDDEREKAIAEIDLWKEKEEEKIKASKASAELKATAVEAIEAIHQRKLQDLDNKTSENQLKKLQQIENFLKQQNAQLETEKEAILQNEIAAIEAKYDQQIQIARDAMVEEGTINEELQQKITELENGKTDAVKDYKEQKELEHAQNIQAIRQEYGLITDEESLQLELDQLQTFLDDKLITEEEYEIGKAQMLDNYRDQQTDKEKKAQQERVKAVLEGINKQKAVLNAYGNFFASQKEAELAAAGDNEEQKKEIAKKYADKEFLITAGNIIANTAQGITKALAQLGPIAGPIAAGAIGATGLIQLNAANAERNRIKGLEHGGEFPVTRQQDGKQYNAKFGGSKRGYISRPTVLVGEENKREFVVSSKSLQHPLINRAVNAIDAYQRSGIMQFNYNKVNRALGVVKGFEAGGTIGAKDKAQEQTATNTDVLLLNLIEAFNAYASKVDNWANELEVFIELQKIRDAESELSSIEAEVKQ